MKICWEQLLTFSPENIRRREILEICQMKLRTSLNFVIFVWTICASTFLSVIGDILRCSSLMIWIMKKAPAFQLFSTRCGIKVFFCVIFIFLGQSMNCHAKNKGRRFNNSAVCCVRSSSLSPNFCGVCETTQCDIRYKYKQTFHCLSFLFASEMFCFVFTYLILHFFVADRWHNKKRLTFILVRSRASSLARISSLPSDSVYIYIYILASYNTTWLLERLCAVCVFAMVKKKVKTVFLDNIFVTTSVCCCCCRW